MRILIVTHAPISPNFGAGQVAINLAEALRHQGHEVILWSPEPLPQNTKWWQRIEEMRSRLDNFLKTQQKFDVIDCPTTSITRTVTQSAWVIARSVQPEILYMIENLKASLNEPKKRGIKGISFLIFHCLYSLYLLLLILQSWRQANHILCLGNLEFLWMKKWFPWWRNKSSSYVNALSEIDQIELSKIREKRRLTSSIDEIKFLWIGRWAAHKGTDTLLNFITQWESLRPYDTFTLAGCGTNVIKEIPPNLVQSGKVKIVPSFTRNELYTLLASHDIGLFTSKVEGWGLSLNEMLESGMPVFATPAGGVNDLQAFTVDLLHPFPPTPALMSELLRTSNISESYYHTFSWEKVAEMYVNLALKQMKNQIKVNDFVVKQCT